MADEPEDVAEDALSVEPPTATGLPPGCPVEPLGTCGDSVFYLDANRQLREVKVKDHTPLKIRQLFGHDGFSYLRKHWPRENSNSDTIDVEWGDVESSLGGLVPWKFDVPERGDCPLSPVSFIDDHDWREICSISAGTPVDDAQYELFDVLHKVIAVKHFKNLVDEVQRLNAVIKANLHWVEVDDD